MAVVTAVVRAVLSYMPKRLIIIIIFRPSNLYDLMMLDFDSASQL